MSDDERLARALQAQFDAEERARLAQEAASERLAQRLAARSHTMSGSEDSDAAEVAAPPRYGMSDDSDSAGRAADKQPSVASGGTGRQPAGTGRAVSGPRRRTAAVRRYSISSGSSDDAGARTAGTCSAAPASTAGGARRVRAATSGAVTDTGRADVAPSDAAVSSAGRVEPAGPSDAARDGSGSGEARQQDATRVGRSSAAGGRTVVSGGRTVASGDRSISSDGRSARRGGKSAARVAGQSRPVVSSPVAGDSETLGGYGAPLSQCPYGASCYRLSNPVHTARFTHSTTPEPNGPAGATPSPAAVEPVAKRRHKDQRTTVGARLLQAEPVSIFLTKVRSLPDTWREPLALGIAELLDPSLGELRSSLQLNFMVDLDWLLEAYAVYGHENKPLTVLHGMDAFRSPQSHITVKKVAMPYPFGTHHTKMMVLEYTEGLRVVIHTANLVDGDWRDKTQGVWVSPLLPPLQHGVSGDSPTGFGADLSSYLAAYRLPCLARWLQLLAKHDFSSVRVFFVGSVPGRYQGAAMTQWGHFRVRKLLQQHAVRRGWDLLIQCSSIGQLGGVPENWLLAELRESLTGGTSSSRTAVIFPTEEDVRTSVEGYDGGSCIPYQHKTHARQLWLRQYLHQWRSDWRDRTRAMPHIKTYTQVSPDGNHLAWFMLTSANLSKAAWGSTEKQGSQVFVRSYEAGVLLLPKMLDCEHLTVLSGGSPAPGGVSLPYSLPLTPYGAADSPWFADTPHLRPDAMGRMLVDNRAA